MAAARKKALRCRPTAIITMAERMAVSTRDQDIAALRLMHLISPSLPVGAFTYSQGLEWAVECGWVSDEQSLQGWVENLLHSAMRETDVPLLARLYRASEAADLKKLAYWSQYLLAVRETRELRDEERNRGRALSRLLPELQIPVTADAMTILQSCQLAGFAYAASHWQIPLARAAAGYLWGWLESMVLAGVKIVPLGQSAGQRIIAHLTPAIPEVVSRGLALDDERIGASSMAQAMASSLHETQYTRIYRS